MRLDGSCRAALQHSVTQLKTEQQGHIVQLDILMRENGRLKEAQEHGVAAGNVKWHVIIVCDCTSVRLPADARHQLVSVRHNTMVKPSECCEQGF